MPTRDDRYVRQDTNEAVAFGPDDWQKFIARWS